MLAAGSRLRARWAGVPSELLTVHVGDFGTAPLPPAHLIYAYLSNEAMARLAPALLCARAPADGPSTAAATAASPRARVLSRDFELPGLAPSHSRLRGRTRLFVYEPREADCLFNVNRW
jgi:hypothetical protein